MIATRVAKEEFNTYFQAQWTDGLTNGLPNSTPVLAALVFTVGATVYVPTVYWPNVERRERLSHEQHFARFVFENLKTSQTSLPGGRVNGGGVKYTTPGIAVVELFFSKSNYTTVEEDFLTAIAQEMFLGKRTTNIWFRTATVKQVPEEEKYYRTNVVVEYEYDTHIRNPA